MNDEMIKTVIYVSVAFLLTIVGIVTYPRAPKLDLVDGVGEPLFEKFDDPLDAKSLEIVRFDAELGKLHRFQVQRTDKGWVIPSHSNYPADAENQMRDAATAFVDLIVDDILPNASEQLEDFGVINPDDEKLSLGQDGVGTLIRLEDAKGKELAEAIVGKKVKNDEEKRFVRIPGQDRVHIVKFDLDKLSTKFEKWIEKDLLKLSGVDLEEVTLKDYSIVPVQGGQALQRKMQTTVKTDTTEGWVLKEMLSYKTQREEPTQTHLSEVEELNDKTLDDLKSALDDLEIVDVQRKPEGLGADLKAQNREALVSMVRRGFFPDSTPDSDELYGSNGEVLARMKNGVEYVLRFGNAEGTEEGTEKLNRYVLVSARVNKDKFPLPELPDELKELPAGPKSPTDKDKDKDKAKDEDTTEKAESKKSDGDEAKETKQDGDEKEKSAEEKKADKEKAEKEKAEKEKKEKLDELRKEHERKVEEQKEKIAEAEKKVKELNGRFADWYYVISEDTYKKMRLRRVDIIKEKDTAEEEGFGIDAFRKLEKEGLKKDEEDKKEDVDET